MYGSVLAVLQTASLVRENSNGEAFLSVMMSCLEIWLNLMMPCRFLQEMGSGSFVHETGEDSKLNLITEAMPGRAKLKETRKRGEDYLVRDHIILLGSGSTRKIQRIKCSYCKTLLFYTEEWGTSSLWDHLVDVVSTLTTLTRSRKSFPRTKGSRKMRKMRMAMAITILVLIAIGVSMRGVVG